MNCSPGELANYNISSIVLAPGAMQTDMLRQIDANLKSTIPIERIAEGVASILDPAFYRTFNGTILPIFSNPTHLRE